MEKPKLIVHECFTGKQKMVVSPVTINGTDMYHVTITDTYDFKYEVDGSNVNGRRRLISDDEAFAIAYSRFSVSTGGAASVNEMVLMIHIPDYESICYDEVISQIKHILGVCGKSLEFNDAYWWLNSDDADGTAASYTNNAKTEKLWKNGWDGAEQKRWVQLTGILYYTESGPMRRNSLEGPLYCYLMHNI